MLLIIFLILLPFFIFSLGNAPIGRRFRSQRESDLHDKIQQAVNYEPSMFRKTKDGKWVNAYGEEGKCYTLKELLEKIENEKT